jgi:hypothetical protein
MKTTRPPTLSPYQFIMPVKNVQELQGNSGCTYKSNHTFFFSLLLGILFFTTKELHSDMQKALVLHKH